MQTGNWLIAQEQILPAWESTSTCLKATRLQWLYMELSPSEGDLNNRILPQDQPNLKLCIWFTGQP